MQLPDEIEFIVSQNDKGGNPKRPDYRGEVKFLGKTYELAAWEKIKQGTSRKLWSGRLKLKAPKEDPGAYQGEEGEQERRSTPAPAPRPTQDANLDEDVPF